MKNKNNLSLTRRIIVAAIILFIIFFGGVFGYVLLEDMNYLDALFMTTITISTVGYDTVKDLSPEGMVFTIVFIIIGTGTVAYIVVNVAELLLKEFVMGRFVKRRMAKMLSRLKNHYIICGLGKVGLEIANELEKNKVDFIIIDQSSEAIEICRSNNWSYLQEDATDDEVLINAGIKKAKGLFAALGTDSDNVYITLSAKFIAPSILIIARATTYDTINKLEKAGADRVLSPQIIGGRRMANMALHPSFLDFLDSVMRPEDMELRLAEIKIDEKSRLDNLTIEEASKKYKFQALIVSILEGGKKTAVKKASANTRLYPGLKMIAIGDSEQIDMLEKLASN